MAQSSTSHDSGPQGLMRLLLLAPVFFTFSLGTNIHYYGRTILHGGAKYRAATGCGFVVQHEKFAENYRMYSRSHFVKALELMVLLICYMIYGKASEDTVSLLVMCSTWFLVGSWLFAPFIFNPAGFEWHKIVKDWDDWDEWINSRGGIGVSANRSWESWWEEEQEHLGISGKLCELFLSSRFFIYRYGILTLTGLMGKQHSIIEYGQSWLVIVVVMIVMKIKSLRRRSTDFLYLFRILEAFISIGIVIVGMEIHFLKVTMVIHFSYPTMMGEILLCLLAFLPTGWGLIQISLVVGRQPMEAVWMWDPVKELASWYEGIMGLVILIPISVFAFWSSVINSRFQSF